MGNKPSSSSSPPTSTPSTNVATTPSTASSTSSTTTSTSSSSSSLATLERSPGLHRLPSLERAPSGGRRLSADGNNKAIIYDNGLGRIKRPTDNVFDDGGGMEASFVNPCGVAYERQSHHIFVSSTDAHRICVIAPDGCVSHLAGSSYGDMGHVDGPALQARFNFPMGIAINHGRRSLYVCDSGNSCVRAISLTNASSPSSSVPGGPNINNGSGGTDEMIWRVSTPWPRIAFRSGGGSKPTSICIHHDDIYVTDSAAAAVYQLSHSGGIVRKWCTVPSAYGIAIDRTGSLWVTSTQESRLYKFNMSQISSTTGACTDKGEVLGSGESGYRDGEASKCSFNAPRGAAIDPVSGLLIIADTHSHTIRGVSIITGRVGTIAGNADWGYCDGFSKHASFDHPTAVAVDHRGFVYVADARNGRIRRIAPVAALLSDSVPQLEVFPSELVNIIGTYLSTEGLVTTVTSDWERSLPGAAARELLSPSYGATDDTLTGYQSPFDIRYDWAPESIATDTTDPRHRHRPQRHTGIRTPTPIAAARTPTPAPMVTAVTAAVTVIAAAPLLALPAPAPAPPAALLLEHQ